MVPAFDDLNIACINSIGGMIVMENRSILARLMGICRAALASTSYRVGRFGILLRESAAIAFTMRCKVIDRR
ncbi:hypothetical protein FHX05_001819 [Rhizobium sp. BK491]|jgi:hypothetical protein|nr:hypothetical protein [Rhizobium sp. BK491]